MTKRRDPNKPPRKRSVPMIGALIQGLSDFRTMTPKDKDDLQAPTVFEDDLEPGVFHEMKPEALRPVQPAPTVPEYVKPVSIVRVSKHEEQLRRTVSRLNSLDLVMKLMQPKEPKPAHNQVHTESGKVITVQASDPKPWRRL